MADSLPERLADNLPDVARVYERLAAAHFPSSGNYLNSTTSFLEIFLFIHLFFLLNVKIILSACADVPGSMFYQRHHLMCRKIFPPFNVVGSRACDESNGNHIPQSAEQVQRAVSSISTALPPPPHITCTYNNHQSIILALTAAC